MGGEKYLSVSRNSEQLAAAQLIQDLGKVPLLGRVLIQLGLFDRKNKATTRSWSMKCSK
jgi:hypothetical protein